MSRRLIHLLLLPLMFMRASPVHTYLLDEVLAEMLGISPVRPASTVQRQASHLHPTAIAAENHLAAEWEGAQPDPLKTPTVKTSAAPAADAVLVMWPVPAVHILPSLAQSFREGRDLIHALGQPPGLSLPLLI